MCHLQPTLQPLRDHAEAHAGPCVLLGLCTYNLRRAPAEVSLPSSSGIRVSISSSQSQVL